MACTCWRKASQGQWPLLGDPFPVGTKQQLMSPCNKRARNEWLCACLCAGLELLRCSPAPRGLRPYTTPAPAHQSPAGIILISADRGINYTQSLGQQEPRGVHTRKAKTGRSVAVGSPCGDLSPLPAPGWNRCTTNHGAAPKRRKISAKARRGRLEARVR